MTAGKEPVRISEGRVTDRGNVVEVSWDVSGLAVPRLWFAVQPEFGHFLDDGCDAAVVALLIPAMQAGRDIEVEGAMSGRLWWGLTSQAMPILRIQRPDLPGIEIHAAEERDPLERVAHGVATGMSNGVDSLNTVLDHVLDPSVPEALRVTHFLFNDVGAHGRDVKALAAQRRERVALTAADLGIPLITTSSNLDDIRTLPFQAVHTFINASVPLALQRGLRRFLYSATSPFDEIRVAETYDAAHADPMYLQAFSTEALECLSVGSGLTRVQKTERIVEMPLARERLDVCVVQSANCSTCWKCARTLLVIEATGHLEDFAQVFNLDAYRGARSRYLPYAIASGDRMHEEAVAYATQRGVGPTRTDYAKAQAWRMYNWGRKKTPSAVRRRFRDRVQPLRRRFY